MKEDAMHNGQLKPGYNLQTAAKGQFITNFDCCHNPGDTLTLIPFLKLSRSRYGRMHGKVIAAAGYGSEENCAFLEEQDIDAYVRYSGFHRGRKRSCRNNAFPAENLYCNEKDDCPVCPMGQHMPPAGTHDRTPGSGYRSLTYICRVQRCTGCPLSGLCHKAKGDRHIEISHRLRAYRKKARKLLTSEEGLLHRSRRPIEPEAVFGQMKANRSCKRFRHIGRDKILMDFAIFAIAFNIGKMFSRSRDTKKIAGKGSKTQRFLWMTVPVEIKVNATQKIKCRMNQPLDCAT
jgi:hypothetical protein